MKLAYLLAILVTLSLCGCIHQPAQSQRANIQNNSNADSNAVIKSLFEQAQSNGVLVIYDGQHTRTYGNDLSRAHTAYVPASTFKMLNALIGIEQQKTTPNEIFKWHGEKRLFATWEKDLSLTDAMHESALPIYQQLALRIGAETMDREVKRIGFGNSNTGNPQQIDHFWLTGPLKITPAQEAEFAYRLAQQSLPLSATTQDQVKKMLLIDDKNNRKIYAKSGWGWDTTPQLGWFTGWVVEPNGKVIAFSLNMEISPKTALSNRQDITYKSLQVLGF